MLCRLTEKLAHRLKVRGLKAVPLQANPLMDWSCHLFFVERAPLIITVNTASLYGSIFPARGVTDASTFGRALIASIGDVLRRDGLADGRFPVIAEEHDAIIFGKSLNKRVTGSMNDLIQLAQSYLLDGETVSQVTQRHNGTPMSMLKYKFPIDEFSRTGI